MFRKAHFLIFILLLMLVVVPLTAAQDGMFGLSADDFALFTSQDFSDFETIGFDFSVAFAASGMPSDNASVSLSGSGLFGEDDSGMPVGTLTVSGAANDGSDETPINVELVIVDGFIYFNMGDGSGWIGQPLDEAMETFSSMAPLPVNPMDLASGDMSENPEAMAAFGEMMGAMSDMDPGQFINIARLDDMSGQAHFQVNLDLATFFSSDAFTQLLGAAGTMSGEESMGEMAPMVAMMLQDTSLTFDEFISLETNRVGQAVLDFAMSINPAMMGDAEADPINVSFNFDISNLQYDVPVNVTAPEGATIMPSSSG